jgi:hypothetical protein
LFRRTCGQRRNGENYIKRSFTIMDVLLTKHSDQINKKEIARHVVHMEKMRTAKIKKPWLANLQGNLGVDGRILKWMLQN